VLTPATAKELCDAIRAHPRVLAIGARTKPRLSAVHEDVALISTRGLSGIVEYDPGEFTFTALAGTPLREIRAALAGRGQYLPFDPPLVDAGATIGGTVAAGLSGPGRFRYGGVRDFILAVQFADGTGQLLRGGAKVVKNAAGFDIPKFFVGSLGRFGVLVELTFKVFPSPPAWLTLRVPCASTTEAANRIAAGASARWELDALDYIPAQRCLLARLGGPPEANAALAEEIVNSWPGTALLSEQDGSAAWSALREFTWAHPEGVLAKIPITLAKLSDLIAVLEKIPGACADISAAGNVAFLSLSSPIHAPALDAGLRRLGLSGVVLRGDGSPPGLGAFHEPAIAESVRAVFDPDCRFARLE
jgi:glycolate oxidase FAD binding subunit